MDETTLEKITALNRVLGINCGGCAISMLAIYRFLKAHKKLKRGEKFVYLYSRTDLFLKQNQKYLEKGEGNPSSCAHAVLFHDRKLWDSTGEFNNFYAEHLELDVCQYESFVVHSINNKIAWCSAFERDISVPEIEKILNVELNDIER